jgi:hypothetical protein
MPKHTWETGETITADKLNALEDQAWGGSSGGIFLVTITPTGETTATSDKSSSEIIAALGQGMLPFAVLSVSNEIITGYPFICIINPESTPTVRFGYSSATQSTENVNGEYNETHFDVTGTTVNMIVIKNEFPTLS